jgi:iron complex outermembrane receptor protein
VKTKIILMMLFLLNGICFADEWENIEAEELEEVVVTTDGFESNIRNNIKNLFVVTKEEIEDKNAMDVWDVIKDIPGVNLISTSSGYMIDMRGQGERAKYNVAILIDGIQINPIDVHSAAPLDVVPLRNIERVEVVPGSGSVVYGNGAAGGVINVITKKCREENFYGDLSLKYGSYKNLNYGINIGKKLNRSMSLNLDYTATDREGYQDEEELIEENINMGFDWKVNRKHHISLGYANYKNKSTEAELLTLPELNDERTQSGYDFDEEIANNKQSREEYKANYKFEFNENIKFNTALFNADTETKHYSDDDLDSIFSDKRKGIQSKLKCNYLDKNEIIIGYDYIDMDAKRDFRHLSHIYSKYNFKFLKDINSVFIINKNDLGKLEFSEGARYEKADYNIVRNTISARSGVETLTDVKIDQSNKAFDMNVNYKYSDTGNTYFRFERGYVSPSPNQFLAKNEDKTYSLNKNLDSEMHSTVEIGIKDFINEKIFASGTIFFTKSKDEIIIQRLHGSGMSDPYFYDNIEKSSKKGGELFFEEYLGKVTVNQTITYVNSKITEGEYKHKKVPYVPEYILGFGAKYTVTKALKFILNTEYRDSYYLDEANSKDNRQESYSVTNIKGAYSLNGIEVSMGINNLFNKKYSTYKYVDIADDGTKVDYFKPAAEINYFAEIKYRF